MSDEEEEKKVDPIDLKFEEMFQKQVEMKKRKELYIKKENEKKEKEELEGVTFKPKISKLGAATKEFGYNFRLKWRERRDVDVAMRKKEQEKKLLEETKKKISLSETTKKIIEKSSYTSPLAGWNERFEKYKMRLEEPKVDVSMFRPRVSEKTIELTKNRGGLVYDRLYEDNRRKQVKLEEKLRQCVPNFQPELTSETIDIVKRNRRIKDSTVFDNLYLKAKRSQMKKTARRAAPSEEFHYKPQINPVSDQISRTMKRKPLYTSPPKKKKPVKPKNASKKKKAVTMKKKEKDEKINRLFENLYNRNIKFVLKKEHNLQKFQQFKDYEQMKECTFEPNLSPTSKKIMKGKNYQFDFGLNKPGRVEQMLRKMNVGNVASFVAEEENDDLLYDEEEDEVVEKKRKKKKTPRKVEKRKKRHTKRGSAKKKKVIKVPSQYDSGDEDAHLSKDNNFSKKNNVDFPELEGLESDITNCFEDWKKLMED